MSTTLNDEAEQTAETLARRVKQLAILNRIGRQITSLLAQEDLFQQVVDAMHDALGYPRVAVMLVNEEKPVLEVEEAGDLYIVAATDKFWSIIPDEYNQFFGEGAIGIAAQRGETIVVEDAGNDPIPYRVGEWLSPSSVSAPIKVNDKLIGILEVEADATQAFDENDVMVIETMAGQMAVAIENARLYAQAQQVIRERMRVEQELRESESKYRAIIEQSHDAIYIYRGSRFLLVNKRVSEITGYSREELLDIEVWHLIHPDNRKKIEAFGERRARGEEVPNTYTAKVLRKDGKIVLCDFSVNVIQYQGQYAVLGVVRDITERMEFEKQLWRQEQLASVGQLAGGIAHDFRNFLTTITLQAQIARRVPDLPPSVFESLEIVISEVGHASTLIDQILDFSRHGLMETKPVELRKFLGETAFILRQAIRENIRFNLAVEVDECVIEADSTRLKQMLVNLAANARDAMPEGGKLFIKLSEIVVKDLQVPPIAEMSPGEWAHLIVSDSGTGMEEEVRKHIFEPFFTTKEVDKGTGLGLAQVYGIVKQHGGFIDLETEVGRGTTFHIYLPVSDTEVQLIEEEKETLPVGRGEKILLVEDNGQLREAGKTVLESIGYQVRTASNGREALEMYQAYSTDLVVTDLVMPGMGGQELRAHLERLGHVNVMAITGYIMQASKEKLKRSGFLEVIEKPFNVDKIAKTIRTVLDRE